MSRIDEFRDPRIDPAKGDEVEVDLGDGEIERRSVIAIERHTDGLYVAFHRDNDTTHARRMKLTNWRHYADDSTILDTATP